MSGSLIPGGSEAPSARPGREGFFLIELDRFQGPLDLLLHLIRHQDIDIFDIPIANITEQFLAAVQEIGVEDLDGAGEFLEMAATLIRINPREPEGPPGTISLAGGALEMLEQILS